MDADGAKAGDADGAEAVPRAAALSAASRRAGLNASQVSPGTANAMPGAATSARLASESSASRASPGASRRSKTEKPGWGRRRTARRWRARRRRRGELGVGRSAATPRRGPRRSRVAGTGAPQIDRAGVGDRALGRSCRTAMTPCQSGCASSGSATGPRSVRSTPRTRVRDRGRDRAHRVRESTAEPRPRGRQQREHEDEAYQDGPSERLDGHVRPGPSADLGPRPQRTHRRKSNAAKATMSNGHTSRWRKSNAEGAKRPPSRGRTGARG